MIQNIVAKAFDEFIISTGGNLDPRGNNNRDRIALYRFWIKLQKLIYQGVTSSQIEDHIVQIISDKTISEDFKSDEGFVVYDHLLHRVEPD